MLIGNVNDDRNLDLLVGRSHKQLNIYLGVPGQELFSMQPKKVAVTMPYDEKYTWLADINKDGKDDILLHHPSTTKRIGFRC